MKQTLTYKVARIMDALEKRYDPEHDTAPGVPSVTYADGQLISAMQYMVMVAEDLQAQVDVLRSQVTK